MDVLRKKMEELDRLRDENHNRLLELVSMKDERLTYQEARIDALQREIIRLKQELNAMYNQLNEINEE